MQRKLLLVDDDARIRTVLGEALREAGYDVSVADTGAAALARLAEFKPGVIVSDVRMPDVDGLELLRLVRERAAHVDVVLMTAFDDMRTVATAMKEGAAEFLVKPVDLDALLAILARIYDDRTVRRSGGAPHGAVPELGLVGRDPVMIDIYKRIGQTAATRATVLIRGESGTGKELIARAIHDNSADAHEPFVAVNCAALPSTLLESELFGHLKGSFTGATFDRRGRFALAGRGTIFLDEIGDTTLELQTKLLRVLQSREFQPLGSDSVERTSARIIAATHRPLEEMVRDRNFREDLYYRLRVVEITVPPLRERRGDIARLVTHLVARAADALGVPPPVISETALAVIQQHEWPGNVRELENCLMRAVVVASGSVIRPEHLSISNSAPAHVRRLASLSEVEKEHIQFVITATGGNKSQAAQVLGIPRSRLARLLSKYGLE